jgi:molybdate transport system regulatory protein
LNKIPGNNKHWLEGELRLSGIDTKMIALLQAIDETGSLSQAAKHCGLSYRGAWQIIERANNTSPHVLIITATGGSKGGGAHLTESGRALLELFLKLQAEHRQFLAGLNNNLLENPETHLLLQRLAVKTSVRNQLFGVVANIEPGTVNAQVSIHLTENLPVAVTLGLPVLDKLGLKIGMEAVLLINCADIIVTADNNSGQYSASNRLPGTVIRLHEDDLHAEVTVMLENGETLSSLITRQSASSMSLAAGLKVWLIFNSYAPVLGIKQSV